MQTISVETQQTERVSAPALRSVGRSTIFAYLVLILVMAFVVVDNARWLQANTLPPAWDETRYLVNSLETFDLIRHPALRNLPELYSVRHGMRPSIGYVWLTVPAYAVFGTNPDTITLWANSILLAVIVFATFGIGRRLFNIKVGLLAGVIMALNPEVIRLTRVFWPHLGVVAVATLGVYLLIRSDGLRRKRYVGLLGLLIAVGLMLRPIYPVLFLIGPIGFAFLAVLVEGIRARRDMSERGVASPLESALVKRLLPAGLLLALPSLVIALPFYLTYAVRMIRFVDSFQESGTFAPVKNVLSLESFTWYVAHLNSSIGLPFVLLFVGGMVVFILALVRRNVTAQSGVLLAWVFVPYVALSLQATKEFFYLAPLYPAIALILAFAVMYLLQKSVVLQFSAGAAIAALCVLLYWQVSWAQPLPDSIARSVLTVPSRLPEDQPWPLNDIVAFIGADANTMDQVTVGTVAAMPHLSEPPLAFYAKANDLNINFIRYTDPLPTLLESDYVITKSGNVVPGRIRSAEHRNADLVARLLENPDSIFYTTHERINWEQRFPLPDESYVYIYKRTQPVSAQETVAVAAELLQIDPELRAAQDLLNTPAPALDSSVDTQAESAAPVAEDEIGQARQQADALMAQGKVSEAIVELERIVELAPNRWILRINLAEAYLANSQLEDAEREAEAAVALAGGEIAPLRTLASIYRQQGRGDEAIGINEQILNLEPNNVRALEELALLYEKKDCDKAVGYQSHVIELRSSNGAYTTLGDILITCGRVGDAIAAYKEAILLDANVARTHFVLARAYNGQGLIQEASRELEIVLELSTNSDLSNRAQQLLDQIRQLPQP